LTKAIADGLEKQGRDQGLAPQPRAVADIATVATEPKAEAEVVTAPARIFISSKRLELKTIRKRNALLNRAAQARWYL